MKDLAIIESNDLPQDERLCNIFVTMLNKFVYILSNCEGTVLLLLEDFATSILRAVQPHEKQIKYMTSVNTKEYISYFT
jgi:hypothetical protein